MPLIRLKDEYLEQEDGVRFLMADELGNTVACKVNHEALRAQAERPEHSSLVAPNAARKWKGNAEEQRKLKGGSEL